MFSCNLPAALLADWPGSFTCYCGNTGVERIPKQESAQKVDPGEENSPAAPAGIRTRNLFDHESGALTTELSPLSYLSLTPAPPPPRTSFFWLLCLIDHSHHHPWDEREWVQAEIPPTPTPNSKSNPQTLRLVPTPSALTTLPHHLFAHLLLSAINQRGRAPIFFGAVMYMFGYYHYTKDNFNNYSYKLWECLN